jgi:hypothetical protein
MPNIEYTGEGLVEVAGLGALYHGRIIEVSDEDTFDALVKRKDFKSAKSKEVTPPEDVSAVINKVVVDSDDPESTKVETTVVQPSSVVVVETAPATPGE